MDSNINKDSGAGEGKGKQNVLLVVLLVLVAVFAYVYFFTGLIKPEKPAEAPQVAKKPLPPSDGAPAKPEAADAAKKDAAPPAAKPEAAPAAPAAPAPVAAAKQPEQSQPAEAVKKPLPGADKGGAKKPAAPEKKEPAAAPAPPAPKPAAAPAPAPAPKPVAAPAPAPAAKPAEVKKPAEKPAPAPAVAKAKPEVRKPVRKEKAESARITGSGPWTVVVGNYVLEEELAENLARVKRAGYEASVVPGGNRKNSMSRLLLAEFTDRESAQAELAKLKKHTADAFMADQGGMHIVYAGSYLLESRATAEMERLAAAGFKLTMKRVEVSLPTKNLTAGPFAEKSAAEEALKKLRPAESKSGGAR